MKLKDTKRKDNLFYVDDYVYFDNTVYKIVYSEGYIGYGYDIFKNNLFNLQFFTNFDRLYIVYF